MDTLVAKHNRVREEGRCRQEHPGHGPQYAVNEIRTRATTQTRGRRQISYKDGRPCSPPLYYERQQDRNTHAMPNLSTDVFPFGICQERARVTTRVPGHLSRSSSEVGFRQLMRIPWLSLTVLPTPKARESRGEGLLDCTGELPPCERPCIIV